MLLNQESETNQQQNRETIVALFAGTGYEIGRPQMEPSPPGGFILYEEKKQETGEETSKRSIIPIRRRNEFDLFDIQGKAANKTYISTDRLNPGMNLVKHPDLAFIDLQGSMANPQECFAYDGCHRRGGGNFAFGVEEPATHLYKELKARLKGQAKDKKITLVLTAHSRGCLSALILAKKINKNRQLRNQVEIVLDLRDPVPGNFNISAKMDVARIATISGKLKDLSHCENIKAAHITVQEKGILNYAFDVLIPRFHSKTKLEVDYLPGLHDVQEQPSPIPNNPYILDPKNQYFLRNDNLYLMGLCQSWKIYLDNHAPLDYQSILYNQTLIKYMTSLQAQPERYNPVVNALEGLQTPLDQNDPATAEQFRRFIDALQLSLYENTFILYQQRTLHIKNRHLHYGGEFKAVTPPKEATHLNFRHAQLDYQRDPLSSTEPKILLGFKGKRRDLNIHQRAAEKIHELQGLIEKQKKHLPPHWEVLSQLSATLSSQANIADPERHIRKLSEFAYIFQRNKAAFDNPKKPDIHRFFRLVGHALASFGTMGVYAIVKAKQSQAQRGSWKFWQTSKEVFKEKAEHVSKHFIKPR